jgi:hypothetical protein
MAYVMQIGDDPSSAGLPEKQVLPPEFHSCLARFSGLRVTL